MYLIPISQEIMQVLYVNASEYDFPPFSQFEHSVLALATPEMTQQPRCLGIVAVFTYIFNLLTSAKQLPRSV